MGSETNASGYSGCKAYSWLHVMFAQECFMQQSHCNCHVTFCLMSDLMLESMALHGSNAIHQLHVVVI